MVGWWWVPSKPQLAHPVHVVFSFHKSASHDVHQRISPHPSHLIPLHCIAGSSHGSQQRHCSAELRSLQQVRGFDQGRA